eukprot:TRINITY_DN1785_c0_g1_i1.p1 TRINITY_DN1785_c0_g1~~TRINITY_DN1785_c0_g1_i1.p1  ORF type:complete len:266 (-),score=52.59 TRINITY_DN1785_c0_g1_i1:158-955(-)
MNIVNAGENEDLEMVNFLTPEEYFFGVDTDCFRRAEQCGIYNRAMIGIRIENVEPAKIRAVHAYYQWLKLRDAAKLVKFNLATSSLNNVLSSLLYFLPGSTPEQGNCARFTSKGLKELDLIERTRYFPKAILVEIFEHFQRENPENINVVSYRRVKHANQHPDYVSYRVDEKGPIKPLNWIRGYIYNNFEVFSDIVVEVPEGSMEAVVRKNNNSLDINLESNMFSYHHEILIYGIGLIFLFLGTGSVALRTIFVVLGFLFIQLWH